MNEVIWGDCKQALKRLPDNSIDLLCTDPPYGYSFMGKDWDRAVPSVETWRECLRVLKPGAFAFIMSAPRQDVLSQMIVRISEAGFDTDFTSMYWTYASGFPKAMNISKAVDKRLGADREVVGTRVQHDIRNNSYGSKKTDFVQEIKDSAVTPEAKALDGSYGGFQPKPAVEVIIVAMKPLSEKTFVDQALKNGKGVTWLDNARIPHNGDRPQDTLAPGWSAQDRKNVEHGFRPSRYITENHHWSSHNAGRFPANLLVSDDVLNDGRVTTSAGGKTLRTSQRNSTNLSSLPFQMRGLGDAGSYSRYFDLDAWSAKTFPFFIIPKASRGEKSNGLDALPLKRRSDANKMMGEAGTMKTGSGNNRTTKFKNHHPTVKPLKLMSYLITLGSRPGDTVLDPFLGSGTTAIAAKQLQRNYIGIEREAEYVDIANARLKTVPNMLPLIADEEGGSTTGRAP